MVSEFGSEIKVRVLEQADRLMAEGMADVASLLDWLNQAADQPQEGLSELEVERTIWERMLEIDCMGRRLFRRKFIHNCVCDGASWLILTRRSRNQTGKSVTMPRWASNY